MNKCNAHYTHSHSAQTIYSVVVLTAIHFVQRTSIISRCIVRLSHSRTVSFFSSSIRCETSLFWQIHTTVSSHVSLVKRVCAVTSGWRNLHVLFVFVWLIPFRPVIRFNVFNLLTDKIARVAEQNTIKIHLSSFIAHVPFNARRSPFSFCLHFMSQLKPNIGDVECMSWGCEIILFANRFVRTISLSLAMIWCGRHRREREREREKGNNTPIVSIIFNLHLNGMNFDGMNCFIDTMRVESERNSCCSTRHTAFF